MAGILDKLTRFARSPQGQRAISTATRKAQEMARDPKNRSKIEQLRSRLGGRGSGGTTPR
ncbi:hypothetical protein SAMN06264364_101438 [Quadrisphaera granulorum]|uniref:Uncharacterized protein n=1 Tax=Quadrisphaera granulorum TaxID=317664 RepID=A0A316AHP4_9ACTN|nr:hypothetical protein [Quadrisphaera granulorum]PWJ56460.1 hypothetical protein BXY45_101438 [Quadrisphaera granulorum]SZE95094.1 hypothetical protein SAMN06264364_101438 [Quadrisphaera granulorum]